MRTDSALTAHDPSTATETEPPPSRRMFVVIATVTVVWIILLLLMAGQKSEVRGQELPL